MAFTIDGTTGIATVDGSVSAPSQRGQDSNSGISYGADSIKFSTNGVERMAITDSGVSGIAAGITEADSWVLTTTYTASSGTDTTDPIASNLARSSFTGASYLGTGMTQSSGIFTFPSTGFWLVTAQFTINVQANRAEEEAQVFIKFTTDGTNYVDASSGYTFGEDYSSSRYSNIAISALLDITNVSTHKIRFKTIMGNTTRVIGSTSPEHTAFKFIRLGDT